MYVTEVEKQLISLGYEKEKDFTEECFYFVVKKQLCLKPCKKHHNSMLNEINRVVIEISNICNYSSLHKKCPAYYAKEKITLPFRTIQKIIDEMETVCFDGIFSFHRYNEPLIDPRFFSIINYAQYKCPKSKFTILTNGFYINNTIMKDLEKYTISCLYISAYSEHEYNRLTKLNPTTFPVEISLVLLDDRLSRFERPAPMLEKQCTSPLRELTINCNGDIVLCCMDFENQHIYGNVNTNTISDIIQSDTFKEHWANLSNGKRILKICKHCHMIR